MKPPVDEAARLREANRFTPGRVMRVAGVSTAAVGLANAIAELGIYGVLIVPRLGSTPHVPLLWWAGMYLPVLFACIAVGVRLRSSAEALLAGLAAGVVAAAEKLLLALVHAPGHAGSDALEAQLRFLTVGLGRMTLGFVLVFLLVRWLSRRGPPNPDDARIVRRR